MSEDATGTASLEQRLADHLALVFSLIILLYASGGTIADAVRWLIEFTTSGFDELSRREQVVLIREHWLGAAWRALERALLQPTGMILGLPIAFGLTVAALAIHGPGRDQRRWLDRLLAVAAASTLGLWIANTFATDAGLLPSIDPIDHVAFLLASTVTLCLTWRLFGGFIASFCLFWVVYLFVRGHLPDWSGVLQGSNATFDQNLRAMVQNFWAQTGGMFGQPIQVVSSNVLIFIVFGTVLVNSGAGRLLMKVANRLAGRFHWWRSARLGGCFRALRRPVRLSDLERVASTGVMTIPMIRRAGFRPAFAGAVEAAASTGGQVMPPVMGVVAFFVAGQIGLQYRYIVVAAILPALFYYMGTFMAVYLEARRRGIGALARRPTTGLEHTRALPDSGVHRAAGVLSIRPVHPAIGAEGGVLRVPERARHRTGIVPRFPQSPSDCARRSSMLAACPQSIIVIVSAIGLIVGLIQLSGFSPGVCRCW